MPTRADWCRIKAGECTALAAAITDREQRCDMYALAREWLDLARVAEWLDQRSPEWVPPDQPRLH